MARPEATRGRAAWSAGSASGRCRDDEARPRGRRSVRAGSFGLLGPGKGYDLAIDALPRIVAAHPTTLYVVVGATQPDLVRDDGETYRDALVARVRRLGMEDHVRFEDRFVGRVERTRWLQAADIVLTPYPNLDQTVSSTLASRWEPVGLSFRRHRLRAGLAGGRPRHRGRTGIARRAGWCRDRCPRRSRAAGRERSPRVRVLAEHGLVRRRSGLPANPPGGRRVTAGAVQAIPIRGTPQTAIRA